MTPFQQMLLGTGVAESKPYLEDMFAITPYKGTGSARSIINNVKLSDGGLTITKNRDGTNDWMWGSTPSSLGTNKYIVSNGIGSAQSDSNSYTAFNADGYSIGTSNGLNINNNEYINYTFKKTPGLLDIVEFTGNNSSSRTLSHSLGSVPGWIVIMCTTKSENKTTWHRDLTPTKHMYIDATSGETTQSTFPTQPTATQFTIGSYNNINGETYVAWLFAGGASTAATAKSVDFDGSGDMLQWGSSSDFTMGTGDFTVEGWVKFNEIKNGGIWQISEDSTGYSTSYNNSLAMSVGNTGGTWNCYAGGSGNPASPQTYYATKFATAPNQWIHFAYSRASGKAKIFLNGEIYSSWDDTYNYQGTYLCIGNYYSSGHELNGKVSNFRVVKGSAVYTTAFNPPTEPLTNISGTVLLCCNNSSVTGSTVTPSTITSSGDPSATNESPFDDPAGFIFGANEDQGIIKCGSYEGDGDDPGIDVVLGWEPQLIFFKRYDTNSNWAVIDKMRGINHTRQDEFLFPNLTNADQFSNYMELNARGFRPANNNFLNTNNAKYIYIAIRNSDFAVGKPAKSGTDVFQMGTGLSTEPGFEAGFPVDWAMGRDPTTGGAMYTGARGQGEFALGTHDSSAEFTTTSRVFDYSNGWNVDRGANSSEVSWMWKRHAGFDCQHFDGSADGRFIPHNLGRIPEMLWVKNRTSAGTNWCVYHKGLNDGTTPEQYGLFLNTDAQQSSSVTYWNNAAHTATHFSAGSGVLSGGTAGHIYQALLFASVSGISKVGSYIGGGSSDVTVSLGFTPRFILIKATEGHVASWLVLDSHRGINDSGADHWLLLDSTNAQGSSNNWVDRSGSNMVVKGGYSTTNSSGNTYVYYAHA
tara:strand:- start:240 stop:2834 length:2595 start_codon:yes stop_codon:yes gene_type:complete